MGGGGGRCVGVTGALSDIAEGAVVGGRYSEETSVSVMDGKERRWSRKRGRFEVVCVRSPERVSRNL